MAVSQEYLEYIIDRLGSVGPITAKRMFGGVGLYYEALFFGLIADNILYFKTDDSNIAEYLEAGMEPFSPYGDGSYTMKYHSVPEDVIESESLLRSWADKSIEIARNSEKSSVRKSGSVKKRRKQS